MLTLQTSKLTRDRQHNDELYFYKLSNPNDAPDWAYKKQDMDYETYFKASQSRSLNEAVEESETSPMDEIWDYENDDKYRDYYDGDPYGKYEEDY